MRGVSIAAALSVAVVLASLLAPSPVDADAAKWTLRAKNESLRLPGGCTTCGTSCPGQPGYVCKKDPVYDAGSPSSYLYRTCPGSSAADAGFTFFPFEDSDGEGTFLRYSNKRLDDYGNLNNVAAEYYMGERVYYDEGPVWECMRDAECAGFSLGFEGVFIGRKGCSNEDMVVAKACRGVLKKRIEQRFKTPKQLAWKRLPSPYPTTTKDTLCVGLYVRADRSMSQANYQNISICKPSSTVATFNGTVNDPKGWKLFCAVKDQAIKNGLNLPTQWAYIMATIQKETAGSFQPVREDDFSVQKSSADQQREDRTWFALAEQSRANRLRYYPYYGRGYVQITFDYNYKAYQALTGCPLLDDPDMALQPDISLFIALHGFKTGAFTGVTKKFDGKKVKKTIEDFINSKKTDYYGARALINLYDKSTYSEVEDMAKKWERDIVAGIACA